MRPRFCVGAALARAEAAEAIEQLLESICDIAPDRDAAPPRFIGHMPRSHEPLNVVLTHHLLRRRSIEFHLDDRKLRAILSQHCCLHTNTS